VVKASALYLVLVIALIVTITLGSLIYLHYFYRAQKQKFDRYAYLQHEMEVATTLSLSNYFYHTSSDSTFISPTTFDDSVRVNKRTWGLFDAISIITFRDKDSLKRSFLSGVQALDSIALYIVDEERPVAISGKTIVQGTAYLPKSGIRPAFVDGEYYDGIKEMVDGKILSSSASLPDIEKLHLQNVVSYQKQAKKETMELLPVDRVLRRSFFHPTLTFSLTESNILPQDTIIGNIVIVGDSSITIRATTVLEDAIIIAPTIRIESGFKGKGQFFASDSLIIEKNTTLSYPSIAGLIGMDSIQSISKVSIGENSQVTGLVFLYKEKLPDQLDVLELAKQVNIQGDVISYGLLKYTDLLHISGSVYCYRFISQRPSSLYENYLINLTIERKSLNPYFVRPHFWSLNKNKKQGIISWLE